MAQKKVSTKKAAGNNKRGPKSKKVEEEKPEVKVEANEEDSDAEEEQNGVNSDDDSDAEANDAADLVDSEAEEVEDDDDEDEDDEDEDDDQDQEDEDEDENETEPGEISKVSKSAAESDDDDNVQEADSDEEPDEEPIDSEKNKAYGAKKTGIPKITIGRIPPGTPSEQILFVRGLPTEYKHIDLVELFAKFGPIAVINRIKSKAGGNNVAIAFESPESVQAALAAKEKALTLNGQVLTVSQAYNKNELNERTVVVGLIGATVTREQIIAHFQGCGEIETVNFSNNRALPSAYVRFASVSSVPKALKLQDSKLNNRFITVRQEAQKNKSIKSPACTLTLMNTGNHESYKTESIEKIFKKHGEIVDIDTVCTRTILAFVTYKTAEQAEKAQKNLNGKKVNDLDIKLESFQYSSSPRSIVVTNVAPGVEEQHLNEIFSEAGEIESIKMLPYRAVIKFSSEDGFCKSFLFNERLVQGQPIFLEPNSILKMRLLKKKYHGKPGYNSNNNITNPSKPFNKRPAQENGAPPKHFKKARNF
ncbi:PREDICTED: DNA-binding protein modulo [Drosophila arizonae]|uniref:DNA-binding protein modulo n=1 Tax=Drosophila arizonae TaxID=7263 RepID=A0ABM1Q063_DROAR|nr:PREDICTED: DNA-binding protein modulo [Drosophila arizonae]